MSMTDVGGSLNRDMSVCLRGGDQRLPEIIPPHGRCVRHDQPHMCPNLPERLIILFFVRFCEIYFLKDPSLCSQGCQKNPFFGGI